MYRVYAVKNYRAKTLTINSRNWLKKVVNGQEADFLMIELVDALEVEDLRMDLDNKKVYQFIDKANEAKYYDDKVKNQRC